MMDDRITLPPSGQYEAVVIGGSSGGFAALQQVLQILPGDFSLPILVVLHRQPTSDSLMSQLLARRCNLPVKEAEDKETIKPGVVYLAPGNYHLLVEMDRTLSLSVDAPVSYARPSIDVLFETAADTYNDRLVGILLSGANHDGKAGLQRIYEQGGLTVAQDPSTAHTPTMPTSAIQAGVVHYTLPLAEIATVLVRICCPTLPITSTGE
jgi:two-component system chemotaxis response regulator CheB